MSLNNFYQGKTDYYYGGYHIGFGIRNISFLPDIWFWISDWRKSTIITKPRFNLQFCFSMEHILKGLSFHFDIFKRFYNVKIKHD